MQVLQGPLRSARVGAHHGKARHRAFCSRGGLRLSTGVAPPSRASSGHEPRAQNLRAFSNYDWASARDDPYPYRRLALTGQPNLLCRYQREIEVAAGHVGTPVCDDDPHGLSSVTHLQLRTEWQASVGRRVVVCVEGMPVRHRTALERAPVVGGHHLLADTILAGYGVEVGVMYCGDTVDSLVTAVIVRDRTGGCQ